MLAQAKLLLRAGQVPNYISVLNTGAAQTHWTRTNAEWDSTGTSAEELGVSSKGRRSVGQSSNALRPSPGSFPFVNSVNDSVIPRKPFPRFEMLGDPPRTLNSRTRASVCLSTRFHACVFYLIIHVLENLPEHSF